MFSSFKQQGQQQWQQVFARSRRGGPLQRVLAWLFLGLLLFVGVTLLLVMLVLSWILIPFMLFRHRAKIKAWQQRQQQHSNASSSTRTVIEGEVIQKRED